jgi:endonuclease/exonuclease/phosphatase (EEP) superfamily protein YafD
MGFRGEIRGLLTAFVLVAAVLVVAASGPLLIPGQPLLQTLRFHLAGGLVLLVVALFIVGARWRGVAFALLAAVSLGQGAWIIYGQQQARAPLAEAPTAAAFDLMSFNILIYNRNGAAIADMILARSPDVVFLFEAAPIFDELPRLAETYPYRAACEREGTCDILMLSKTPLEDVAIRSLSEFSPNRTIFAVSEIGGQRVNLVAVHMTKPYFDFAAEGEAWTLARYLERLTGPVVMAGDFNAAPWSRNMQRLAANADLVHAPGYPATWPMEAGPLGVPIDNVFTRAPAIVESVAALPDPMGSNHRGIVARIAIKQE